MRVLLVAIDGGPRQVMAALCCEQGCEFPSREDLRDDKISSVETYDAMIVGTSGSEQGRKIEHDFRVTAKKRGVPLVVIEDYPGNYQPIEGGDADILIVDCEFSRKRHLNTLLVKSSIIKVIENPRYDALRQYAQRLNSNNLPSLGVSQKKSLLWAGQPETEDALKTLTNILPVLKNYEIDVYFKAHPRDKGYHQGAYKHLFFDCMVDFHDVTKLQLRDVVNQYAPQLIVTHYSSLAIEGGFYGIPSLHVLFEEAGAPRLLNDKGFSSPPWCVSGAAWAVFDNNAFIKGVERIFFNDEKRTELLKIFEHYFGFDTTAKAVINVVKSIATKTL